MKKISFLTALLFCTMLVWKSHHRPSALDIDSQWVAYEKAADQEKVIVRTPTEQERVFLGSDEKQPSPEVSDSQASRSIASTAPPTLYQGRMIFGQIDQEILDEEAELNAINEPDPDWKNSMAQALIDTQESSTTLFLKHLNSVVMVRGQMGRYAEEVLVTFQLPNKNISSYIALVDSQTGQMISTWSPTINHNYRAAPPRLSPSGALFSPAQ